ncbi:MAG: MFS transporter [Myxococcales bacterium]|nr:MFS transporter [Myxococcales bacterium]
MSAPASPPATALTRTLGRALRHRNYRLFFVGQGTSMIGTWITRVALGWLVFRLTRSEAMLGVVGFAGQLPTFLLAPLAGVLVDRWDRHRVLVVTQVLSLAQSAALAALALTDTITVAHVLALAACQGLINAFDTPARQAMVVELIEDRADLPNAIALNSTLVNSARLVGPSIAGVLIAAVGEGWCFAIDAISYLAVIASLLAMRIARRPRPSVRTQVLADLRAGLRYAWAFGSIRALLMLLAMVSLTGVPYMVLMPVFATDVLGGGPHVLGLCTGAVGLGAVTGALWLAARPSVRGLERQLVGAAAAFGLGLCGFALSRWLWLSLPLLVATGAGMMTTMAATNTLVQTLVDEDKRGRVMSFYTMAFFGMAPFGALGGGVVAAHLGAPAAVAIGGVATLVAVALFLPRLPELTRATIAATADRAVT